MLTIRYTPTTEDHLAYYRYHGSTDPQVQRVKRWVTWFFPLIFLASAYALTGGSFSGSDLIVWVYFAFAIVLWIIFVPGLYMRTYLKKVRKIITRPENAIYLKPVEMTFEQEQFDVRSEGSSSQVSWSTVLKGVETSGHWFLCISGASAFVIPKNQLTGDEVQDLNRIFQTRITQINRLPQAG